MNPVGGGVSVLVDARTLFSSGIGRYLREILARILDDRAFGEVVLLGDRAALERFLDGTAPSARVRLIDYPARLYSPRVQLAWLGALRRERLQPDVAFFPHYDAPVAGVRMPTVVTVHDLTHFKVPEAFPGWRRWAAGLVFDRVVRAATCVVAVSRSTARDITTRLPGAAGKVNVVPNGVGPHFRPVAIDSPGGRPELRPFLLCVGNRKPHKNLVAAVEVLALVRQEQPSLRLVVAGRSFPGWQVVLERAAALGVREAIVEIEDASDGLLRWLYSHAEALLFPSFYEGFGLPALEAMACGSPVVASARAALPEVVGRAGVLVEPSDYPAMAEAVRWVRDDAALRQRLRERGLQRARQFTWAAAAGRTAEILHAVARGGRPAPAMVGEGAVSAGPEPGGSRGVGSDDA